MELGCVSEPKRTTCHMTTGMRDSTTSKRIRNCPPPPVNISWLDIRVGIIMLTQHHPLSSHLIVNHVIFGDDEEESSISCLRRDYTRRMLKHKLVLVVCNIKYKVKRLISRCFILFANTENKSELLNPPPESKPGDHVYVPDFPFKPQKKPYISPNEEGERVLKEIVKDMVVDCDGKAVYKGIPLLTRENGFVTTETLRNCLITI